MSVARLDIPDTDCLAPAPSIRSPANGLLVGVVLLNGDRREAVDERPGLGRLKKRPAAHAVTVEPDINVGGRPPVVVEFLQVGHRAAPVTPRGEPVRDPLQRLIGSGSNVRF